MMCVLSKKSVINYRKYELNSVFFTFIFFNMDISVTTHDFELKFTVCHLNILVERSMSKNLDLGPSLFFCQKTGTLW